MQEIIEWIPVTERLPEYACNGKSVEVLVSYRTVNYLGQTCSEVLIGTSCDKCRTGWCENDTPVTNATHWAALPKGPQ